MCKDVDNCTVLEVREVVRENMPDSPPDWFLVTSHTFYLKRFEFSVTLAPFNLREREKVIRHNLRLHSDPWSVLSCHGLKMFKCTLYQRSIS